MEDSYMVNFMLDMKKKLAARAHKGGRSAWRKESKLWLFIKMLDENTELKDALLKGTPDEIISECADVANYAMMIADVARTESNLCGQ